MMAIKIDINAIAEIRMSAAKNITKNICQCVMKGGLVNAKIREWVMNIECQ